MLFLSPVLSERIEGCVVERSLRAGVQPSDHTPLCLDLAWEGVSALGKASRVTETEGVREQNPPPETESNGVTEGTTKETTKGGVREQGRLW